MQGTSEVAVEAAGAARRAWRWPGTEVGPSTGGGSDRGRAAGPGLPARIAPRRDQRGRRRLRRAVVPTRAAGRRGGDRPDDAHLHRLHLRPLVLGRVDAARRGARPPPRGLPGLRPPRHRLPAVGRAAGPLRQRLHRDRGPARTAQAGRGRRLPRVVRDLRARVGMAGPDPTNDQVAPGRHITVAWGRDYRDVAPLRGWSSAPPRRRSSRSRWTSAGCERRPPVGRAP